MEKKLGTCWLKWTFGRPRLQSYRVTDAKNSDTNQDSAHHYPRCVKCGQQQIYHNARSLCTSQWGRPTPNRNELDALEKLQSIPGKIPSSFHPCVAGHSFWLFIATPNTAILLFQLFVPAGYKVLFTQLTMRKWWIWLVRPCRVSLVTEIKQFQKKSGCIGAYEDH